MVRPIRSALALGLLAGLSAPAQAQWAEAQKLLAGDGAAGDFYGWSVDVSGDVALVGAWGDDDAGGGAGAAYVYRRDAAGGQWVEEQKLTAGDAEGGKNFGWAVALDGDVALVGAGFDDDNGAGAGAAYVFRYDAAQGRWVQEQKLTASDGTPMDRFGHAVDVDDGLAVIGAAQDDDVAMYAGSAYVFRYDPAAGLWAEEQKLTAGDGAFADNLGAAVSVSVAFIDAILLGAETDDQGLDAGAAYTFRYDDASGRWVETQKLLASDGEALDYFGGAVALDGGLALVGAERDTEGGIPTGSAYVFRYDVSASAWVEQQKLTASDGAAFDNFGFSVALDHPATALVGAFVADAAGPDAGAAYVFRYDAAGGVWTEEEKLVPADGAASDDFGVSVALDGDVALVGADAEDGNGAEAGAAYVFRPGTGTPVEGGAPATTFALARNAPNPVGRSTVIAYTLPEAADVRLAVYDVLGREVAVLVDSPQAAGRHAATWRPGALPSGAYVYRLEAGGRAATRTLLLAD